MAKKKKDFREIFEQSLEEFLNKGAGEKGVAFSDGHMLCVRDLRAIMNLVFDALEETG